MGNMSYCRFENTLRNMQDCVDHLDEDGNNGTSLSETEARARQDMIELCCDIAEQFGDDGFDMAREGDGDCCMDGSECPN